MSDKEVIIRDEQWDPDDPPSKLVYKALKEHHREHHAEATTLCTATADLRRELAASQQEAAAMAAMEREVFAATWEVAPYLPFTGRMNEWRRKIRQLERQAPHAALDAALAAATESLRLTLFSMVCSECGTENVNKIRALRRYCVQCGVPFAGVPSTRLPYKEALAAAEKRGRDTEHQLTKEVITLARQRLRREGLEAAAVECDRRALQWHMTTGNQCSGELAMELDKTADAIRALPLGTGEGE